MSAETVSFVGVLVRRCRFLLPVLSEHLEGHEGEVLPHPFMADVERWAESALQRGATEDLADLMEQLEAEFNGLDEEVREVIAASFLEHLPSPGASGSELRDLVGPACAKQLRAIGWAK